MLKRKPRSLIKQNKLNSMSLSNDKRFSLFKNNYNEENFRNMSCELNKNLFEEENVKFKFKLKIFNLCLFF